jgi:hypothetical protein
MTRHLLVIFTALLMVTGLVVLTWSFHNLELTSRPEWMNWQMLIWPLVVFGLLDGLRWMVLRSHGLRIRVDGFRLLMHGGPAIFIALLPAGYFTMTFGSHVALSLLDFPTAKTMAALWFAATVFSSWEVTW